MPGLLNEARALGDRLLGQAARTAAGAPGWSYVAPRGRTGAFDLVAKDALYDGAAGTALFLGELGRQSGERRFFAAATEVMEHLLAREEQREAGAPGFYCGSIGTACAAVRLAALGGDPGWPGRAAELARRAGARLVAGDGSHDVLLGRAGVALGLLHLWAATGREDLLAPLGAFVRDLLATCHPAAHGVCWDRGEGSIHGLCGFAHGVSGIAFALLEIGHHLGDAGCLWLAERALDYESACFDETLGDWPDFRRDEVPPDPEPHLRRHQQGDVDYLVKARAMVSWCNGAVGIGLVRLRAWEILGRGRDLDDARKALAAVARSLARAQSGESFNLCHGLGGSAELFLEAHRVLGDTACLEQARRIACDAVAARRRTGSVRPGIHLEGIPEDPSLLLGTAGVGYFLLRAAAPAAVPSILLPRTPEAAARRGVTLRPGITIEQGRRALLQRIYPRTLALLEQENAERVAEALTSSRVEHEFLSDAESVARWADCEACAVAVAFETHKRRMDLGVVSDVLLAIEEISCERKAGSLLALADEDLLRQTLRLRPGADLLPPPDGNAAAILVRPAARGPLEIPLGALAGRLLAGCRAGKNVEDLLTEILNDLEADAGHVEAARRAVLAQVREAIRARLLISI